MKRILLCLTAAAFALGLGAPSAMAGAIGGAKEPIDWSGPYWGISGGKGWGQSKLTDTSGATTGDFDLSGAVVGLDVGYNWQVSSLIVGLEADGSLSTIDATTTNSCGGGCATKLRWLSTLRVNVGYPIGKFLPYVTGGAAAGRVKANVATISKEETKFGWTAGGGLAYAFTTGFSTKIEYLYTDLSDVTVPTALPVTAKADDFQMVRIGLNFAF